MWMNVLSHLSNGLTYLVCALPLLEGDTSSFELPPKQLCADQKVDGEKEHSTSGPSSSLESNDRLDSTQRKEVVEWISGPQLNISGSDNKRQVVFNIPNGYVYTGYRIKEGSVVVRASYTIRYVEAKSDGELQALINDQRNKRSIEGNRASDMPQSTAETLGSIESAGFRPAALIVHGTTMRNKLFRPRSMIHISVDVGVVRTEHASIQHGELHCPDNGASTLCANLETRVGASQATDGPSSVLQVDTENVPIDMDVVVDVSAHRTVAQGRIMEFSSGRALHEHKQRNPSCQLSTSQSMDLLNMYITEGIANSQKLSGKEVIVVLGSSGVGKSTFLNYLMGCKLTSKDAEEMGIEGLEDKVVTVLPLSEGGPLDEIMPIGHGRKTKTFLPQIEGSRSHESPYAYCDCPTFLERWPEVNIANVVSMRIALRETRNVRLVVLINYNSLAANRGRGLADTLQICLRLFGSSHQVRMHKDSVLLGITHVPAMKRLDKVRKFILDESPEVLGSLVERMFFFDVLDQGGEDFSTLAGCWSIISALTPLEDKGTLFHVALTESEECLLKQLTEHHCSQLEGHLSNHEYELASSRWHMLQLLKVLDNLAIDRILQQSRSRLLDHVMQIEIEYQRLCKAHDFVQAECLMNYFVDLNRCFSGSATDLDLPDVKELRWYLTLFKKCADKATCDSNSPL